MKNSHNQQAGQTRKTLKVIFTALFLLVWVAGCSMPAPTEQVEPTVVLDQSNALPTETEMPPTATATATETEEPTATPTTPPTATATLEPSATPIPALAVMDDGFSVWCSPLDEAGWHQPAAQGPQSARVLNTVNGQLQVIIPADFCVAVYTFNQLMPEGTSLWMYDGGKPFIKAALTPDPAQPQVGYAAFNHPYVVNPPLWEISYRVAVVSADEQELRSDEVKFAKVLPSNCPYGGLPDPVTLACAASDPWEVEPVPNAVYPYPTHTPQP